MKLLFKITLAISFFLTMELIAQDNWQQKFEQLGTQLPTPNTFRNASGAPGKDYWQQQADYTIAVKLDDDNQKITGKETITYYNNSPDALSYLWLQLDQNINAKDSDTPLSDTNSMRDTVSTKRLVDMTDPITYDGGFKIEKVMDANGNPLKYTINKTMMRIDLPTTLAAGSKTSFSIEWSFMINDRMMDGGRSGYEYFPADDNYVYTIAQFFPRMAVYDDVNGWQNKQFLGSGEFTLTFGNYTVDITVPADFIVGATGTLVNAKEILTKDQWTRFEKAKNTFDNPVIIVTQDEAVKAEKTKSKTNKTWSFKAENVRDFAFAASRKFIWDAMATDINGKKPLAMSYYSKEGNPLWEQYSTRIVAHTIKTYSKYTIDYPYPVAISVHAASIGMEYPMICFNYGRPKPDGTYSDRLKYGMMSVIIHEVGHNFFPMIINSDERQWTWMDEGLNSFVQTLTERAWDPTYPIRRGLPENIGNYMKGDKNGQRPIMTNSEQILQFGNNAYAKPSAALHVLREAVMGPELFDYAFKTYAERWAFKNPTPADFFRTMEDASAVDLDWFWKGWFYTTDHVDIAVDDVKWYKVAESNTNPESKVSSVKDGTPVANTENATEKKNLDQPQPFVLRNMFDAEYREFMNRVDDQAIRTENSNKNFYEVTFTNQGGLVTPIIVEWKYKDGTTEREKLPAEIWRYNEQKVTKVFAKDKEVVGVTIDPSKQTADTELSNNIFPRVDEPNEFEQMKKKE